MEIHLKWHGPYSLEDVRNGEPGETSGLYQYIGMNDVYRPAALLYIGMSERPISRRLEKHNLHLWSSLPVKILIGNLAVPKETKLDGNEWRRRIKWAESLLIYTHSPAWNSSNIQNVNWSKVPALHIFNWGVRGRLLPEVSTKRWRGYGNKLPKYLEVQGRCPNS